jgi:predicted HTH domain antitoxin
MKGLAVQIPSDIVQEFEPYQDRLREIILLGLKQLKVQDALLQYERGLVSLGRAAEIAELSTAEMIRQARALDIGPRWSEKMVNDELA